MRIQFEIEEVIRISFRNKFYVFVKELIPGIDWNLSDQSNLGEVEIEKWLDIPRAHDKNGNIRFDLFVFELKNNDDNDTLTKGDIVELIP